MATASEIKITEAYIGLLGRAPDPLGLDYWVGEYDKKVAAGGNADVILKKIMNDFTLSDEWDAGLGANVTKTTVDGVTTLSYTKTQADTVVKGIYGNLFERPAPSDAEVKYYSDQLQDGTVTASEMAVLVILGAGDDGTDHDVLGYKTEAATFYVETIATSDYNDAQATTAVDAVQGPVTLLASQLATTAIATGEGTTKTLTTATDTIVMTGGDDVITGTSDTMATADSVADKSTSDNDSLTLTADGDVTFGTVTNVENVSVSLSKIVGAGTTLNATKLTGGTLSVDAATEVDVDGTDVPGETVISVTALKSNLSTTDVTQVTTSLGAAASVTITGDADLKTITATALDSNDTAIVLANNDSTVALAGDTNTNDSVSVSAVDNSALDVSTGGGELVEAVTLSGNGGAVNFTVTGATGGSMAYAVAGDQDVTLTGAAAMLTTAKFTDSSTAGDTTVVISDGDTTDLFKFGVVDGGVEVAGDSAGATTLTLAGGNTVKVSADQTVGALKIDANDALTTTAMTLDVDNDSAVGITIEDIETLQIDAGTAALSLAALDMDANDAAVTYVGLGNLTATNIDTGSLKMTTGGLSATTVDALKGTLQIDATNDVALTGTMTAQNDINITADDITLVTVTDTDPGTLANDLTLTATNDISVTTAITQDNVTLTGDDVTTTTVTADNDIVITATNDAAVGTLTAGAGDITISGAQIDGAGVTATAGDVTLTGTNDSGSATMTSTITAVSAAAGKVATSSGDFAITTLTGETIMISGDAKVTATTTVSSGSIVVTSTNDVALGTTDAVAVTVVGTSDVSADFQGGTAAATTVTTGSGNDTLTLNDDVKFVVSTGDSGATGDSVTVTQVAANSTIDMGAGKDAISISDTNVAGLTVDMGEGQGTATLTTNTAEVQITMGSGTSDKVVLAAGAQAKVGFTGVEEVDISAGNATFTWENLSANDTTFELTGSGADKLILSSTSTANTTGDTIGLTGMTLNGLGVATLDVTGGDGNDTITGSTDLINDIGGGAGFDSITGGANADILTGDAGNDTLTGGLGADQFTVSAGADTITDFGAGGVDKIDITGGSVAVAVTADYTAGAAGDIDSASAATAVFTVANGIDFSAAAATDTTAGITLTAAGNSTLSTLTGTDQADIIIGSSGNDIIDGGAEADIITGGAGGDVIDLGTGANKVVYTAITDGSASFTNTTADFAATTADAVDNTFVVASDKIKIDGALEASLVGAGIGTSAAALNMDTTGIYVILTADANMDGVDTFTDVSDVFTNLAAGVAEEGVTAGTADAGDVVILAIENSDATKTGVYVWTDTDGSGTVNAGDAVALLGVFTDAVFTVAEFTFA